MTKYDEQFKLKIVRKYLAHKGGYRALADKHDLHHSVIERWVNLHRLHGVSGLAKKQVPGKYDVEFRLSVLKCLWDNQLSYREVAALFNIRSPGCIGNWERSYHNGGIDALIPRV
ncbi:transposase, partial [Undibacterium sp. TC4M20W]|uniref:transposase n=1 Tax=Undibacterium sp. TC4M20W TaxID=3413052 RepID=UPI003BF39F61